MPNWLETSQTPQPLSAVLDLPEAAALYKTPPPPFGHALLQCFAFDPAYINLNHGQSSYAYAFPGASRWCGSIDPRGA